MTALFRISAGLGKFDGNKSKKPSLIIIFRFNGAETCKKKKKKKNPNNQIFVKCTKSKYNVQIVWFENLTYYKQEDASRVNFLKIIIFYNNANH